MSDYDAVYRYNKHQIEFINTNALEAADFHYYSSLRGNRYAKTRKLYNIRIFALVG